MMTFFAALIGRLIRHRSWLENTEILDFGISTQSRFCLNASLEVPIIAASILQPLFLFVFRSFLYFTCEPQDETL